MNPTKPNDAVVINVERVVGESSWLFIATAFWGEKGNRIVGIGDTPEEAVRDLIANSKSGFALSCL